MRRVHGRTMQGTGRHWRLPCLLFALAAAGAAMAEQARPPATEDGKVGTAHTRYRMVNLGSGPLSTLPNINAKGQVTFSLNPGPASRGYFYNGAIVQDIGTLGGAETLAIDLNDAGQVTGGSTIQAGNEHAFVWTAGGGMLDLGVLPGASNARAKAINRYGVVTGSSEGVPLFAPRAFRWSAVDGMENLGAFTAGLASFSTGDALNDAGLITGSSSTADFDRHAFAWTPATGMLDLGTAGGTESFVMAMSPAAHIAGIINLASGDQRAMSWTRATGMRNLGTLGGRTSVANDVNSKGQIVGLAYNKADEARAFAWTARQGMIDLNRRLRHAPPGLVVEHALAINDSGAIVATSNAGLVLLKPGHGHKGPHAAPPVLGPIAVPGVVKTGAPLHASVAWTDEDRVGTRSVSWSWGDGSGEQAGRVREANGVGSASASHNFAAPGIYPLKVTVLDRSRRSMAVSRSVVVTAPGGGTVAASGALLSPPGAFRHAPFQSGKATFSLIAPASASARAAGIPARLHFDLPGLSFRSDDVRVLGQQGAQRVFAGSGAMGRTGHYRFRLATTAGVAGAGGGRFALRIWHADPVTGADVLDYDNATVRSGPAASRVLEGGIVHE